MISVAHRKDEVYNEAIGLVEEYTSSNKSDHANIGLSEHANIGNLLKSLQGTNVVYICWVLELRVIKSLT